MNENALRWYTRPKSAKQDVLLLQGTNVYLTVTRPVKGGCHYCGKRATTRDHVVPKAKHGRDAWWNLVPACAKCNSRKADDVGSCTCEWCCRARFFMKQYLDWGE